jgi:hypothetical protein
MFTLLMIFLGMIYSFWGGLEWIIEIYNNFSTIFVDVNVNQIIIEESSSSLSEEWQQLYGYDYIDNSVNVQNIAEKISLDNKLQSYMNDYDSLEGDNLNDLAGNSNSNSNSDSY